MEDKKDIQRDNGTRVPDKEMEKVSGGWLLFPDATNARYAINTDECIGCMCCIDVCPCDAISEDKVDGYSVCKIDLQICGGCGVCEQQCPVAAINVI